MKIVGGSSSIELAVKISNSLKVPIVSSRMKRFPDGELYFKLNEDISNEDILVVQSLEPPQEARLVELFMMLHASRDMGAQSTILFIPYLAYSRQDERYLDGECVSSVMVAELLEELGIKALYTIDIHNSKVLKQYRVPTYNLTAAGELAGYYASKGLKDPLIVAPDNEEMALSRVQHAAKVIDAECDYLGKERDRHTGDIDTIYRDIDADGRDIVIIDDIIATGKTTANAARMLKKHGAQRVFVGVSHLLLLDGVFDLLGDAGVEEVVGTDSIQSNYSKVSVAPVLARTLRAHDASASTR